MADLTESQREQSALAESQGLTFSGVTFEQLLANGALSQRCYTLNPARYFAIRQDYRWRTGQEPRPEGFCTMSNAQRGSLLYQRTAARAAGVPLQVWQKMPAGKQDTLIKRLRLPSSTTAPADTSRK